MFLHAIRSGPGRANGGATRTQPVAAGVARVDRPARSQGVHLAARSGRPTARVTGEAPGPLLEQQRARLTSRLPGLRSGRRASRADDRAGGCERRRLEAPPLADNVSAPIRAQSPSASASTARLRARHLLADRADPVRLLYVRRCRSPRRRRARLSLQRVADPLRDARQDRSALDYKDTRTTTSRRPGQLELYVVASRSAQDEEVERHFVARDLLAR